MNSKRIYSFDVMRIFAACAVIMLHITADYVEILDKNTWDFVCVNFFNSISRFAVPTFVMISGALMLDENRDMSSGKMGKTISNMLFILFSWSFFYAISYNLVKPLLKGETISVSAILNTFFNGHYHMWYIYLLVGLYIITPLLRFFTKKENAALIYRYLVLSFLVCFGVPFVDTVLNHFLRGKSLLQSFVGNFRLGYFYEYLFYYVLGWYITQIGIPKSKRRYIYLGGIFGVMLTFFGMQLHPVEVRAYYFYTNNSINIFAYGVGFFTFIYYLFQEREIQLKQHWVKLSNYTFGVYLIQCCFFAVVKKFAADVSSVCVKLLIVFIFSAIFSFLAVSVLSKIPFLKRFVRG